MQKIEKRYPRGNIFLSGGKTVTGESIMQDKYGINFFKVGKSKTIFIPYDKVERIDYEVVPEKLRQAEDI